MMRRALILVAAMLACATLASAQSAQQRLLTQARADLENLDADAARTKLIQALGMTLTPVERTRAFTLLAFAEIGRTNSSAAPDAFVQALRIDATLKVDSLMFLEASQGPGVFALARAIVPLPSRPTFPVASRDEAVAVLGLNVVMPRDTLISTDDARYMVGALPTWSAEVISSVVAADKPNVVIWADTIRANAGRQLSWPLKTSSGQLVPIGRYVMRLQATDSTGRSSTSLEYRLVVSRARADTQALPAPLQASSFTPETLQVGKRSARVLLAGSALAAAVVVTPAMLGNSSLNSGLANDPMSFAVAGGVAVASVVRFIVGRQPTLLSQENVKKNQDARDVWQRNRDRIASANATAIARAGIRVQREGQ